MRCSEQAKKCDFGKTEAESRELRIIDKIVYHAPAELREKLLREEKLTLTLVTRIVSSFESIKNQVQAIARDGSVPPNIMEIWKDNVNRVYQKPGNGSCYRCGQKNHYGNDQKCPARNKKCEKCNRMGHYAKVVVLHSRENSMDTI